MLETDHKALISVFNRERVNKDYSPRLIQWRHRLLPYEFEVIHRPGETKGITDYLSRSPGNTEEKGEFDDGIFTIMLLNDINTRKNNILKCRILAKLIEQRKKLRQEPINRIQAKKSNKQSKYGATKRKGTKRTEKRNKVNKKISKYDDVISACFSELTIPKETIKSLERTMQTADSLSKIANRLKVLSLENRQNTANARTENLKFCDLPISQASN